MAYLVLGLSAGFVLGMAVSIVIDWAVDRQFARKQEPTDAEWQEVAEWYSRGDL